MHPSTSSQQINKYSVTVAGSAPSCACLKSQWWRYADHDSSGTIQKLNTKHCAFEVALLPLVRYQQNWVAVEALFEALTQQ
jgi:hypothetical protein